MRHVMAPSTDRVISTTAMSIVGRLAFSVLKALFSVLKAFGSKRIIGGLPVWTPFFSSDQRQAIHARISDALLLLKTHSPAKFSRVRRSLSGFLVFGKGDIQASYEPSQRLCRLSETLVLAPETPVVAIATSIVHEATHGWLSDRGIGYAEPIRHRVEQICIRAALQSAQQLPGAEEEIERCQDEIRIEPEYFSNAQSLERSIARLRELNCPEWVIRAVLRIRQRRAA
jgi:hypothetical protein